MKAEGWKFPPVREAEAMFEADIAPDWSDGDVCHRCRVQVLLRQKQFNLESKTK
jgi:growth factor-regulated tyrosine kinase substrate